MGWTTGVRFPAEALSLSPPRPDSCPMGTGVKAARASNWPLTSDSAEAYNVWSYTLHSPYVFLAGTGTTLPSYLAAVVTCTFCPTVHLIAASAAGVYNVHSMRERSSFVVSPERL